MRFTHNFLSQVLCKAVLSVGLFFVLSFVFIGTILAASTWTQTDWSGGPGQASFTDITKFSTSTDIDYATTGQLTIQAQTNWYNASWDYRKNITFDNSAQASNLINFPAQVALTSSNFDFSKAQSNGEDIRFTDSNGTTLLDYEIEKWDQAGETAWVWVNVPQINASSGTDNIYMYYGNPAASDTQDPEGTWNSNYALVYHLGQTGTCPPTALTDSTSYNNDGSCIDEPAFTNSGKIDGARTLNGSTQYLYATDSPDFTASQMTVSLWANQDSLTNAKSLASKWFYSSQGSWAIQTGNSDNTQLQVFIANALNDPGDNNGITTTGAWSTGWHNVTFTYDSAGSGNSGKLKVYVDGVAQSLSFNGTIPSSMQDSNTNLRIGDFGALSRYWNGSLDEVRIATSVQTPDWIAASYKSENNTFNTFGTEEGLYPATASLTSSIFDTDSNTSFDALTYSATTPSNTAVAVKVRTSNSSSMTGAPAFGTCTAISSGADMSANACVTDTDRYIQYLVTLTNTDDASTPTFSSISLNYTSADPTPTPASGGDGGGSSSSGGGSSSTSCTLSPPINSPNLFQISSTANTATLSFTPTGGDTTGYTISYGTTKSASQFSSTFNNSDTSGAQTYTINDLTQNTIWYFKIRSNNGCAPGSYAGVTSASTTSPVTQNIIQKVFAKQNLSPVSEVRKVAKPTPTPTKAPTPACSHTVQSGDTLWKIARKYLGEGARFEELITLNKSDFPFIEEGLTLGDTIMLPCKKEAVTEISEKQAQASEIPAYDLKIKLSADGKPLSGAAVEIHSKVQKTIASSEGVASFKNVEPGEHTVIIAYENYTGEHKIALTGDEEDVDIDLSIKLVQNGFTSRPVQIVIGVLSIAIVAQAIFIWKRKKRKKSIPKS